jgi:hypothetical protein
VILLRISLIKTYWLSFASALRTKNIVRISQTELYKKILGVTNPATILPHELEHARRTSSHDSSHEATYIQIPGKKSELYGFDDGANEIWLYAIQRGMFSKWLNML